MSLTRRRFIELAQAAAGAGDFRRLRAEPDPEGRLLNAHLRSLFAG